MHHLFSTLRLALCTTLCLVMLTVSACTLIYIEGSSNSVSETGGHSVSVPTRNR